MAAQSKGPSKAMLYERLIKRALARRMPSPFGRISSRSIGNAATRRVVDRHVLRLIALLAFRGSGKVFWRDWRVARGDARRDRGNLQLQPMQSHGSRRSTRRSSGRRAGYFALLAARPGRLGL